MGEGPEFLWSVEAKGSVEVGVGHGDMVEGFGEEESETAFTVMVDFVLED